MREPDHGCVPARRADIDALRVGACAAVVLVHAVLVFAPAPAYHVKAARSSWMAGAVADALLVTAMPLFFALAGWAAVSSLRRQTVGSFMRARIMRLGLPLAAGLLLLCPPIKYLELQGGLDLRPSGLRIVPPGVVTSGEVFRGFFTRLNGFTWSHLWFLVYLLLLTFALLPVWRALARSPAAARVVSWRPLAAGAVVYTALVIVAGGYWPYYPNLYRDWGNVACYGAAMLAGGALARWPGLTVPLGRAWPLLLAAWAVACGGMAVVGEGLSGRACVGVATSAGVAGWLGLAHDRLPGLHPGLATLAHATLPVYVLHHLPLVWLATRVPAGVPWVLAAGALWAVTLVVTWLVYWGLSLAPVRAGGPRPG